MAQRQFQASAKGRGFNAITVSDASIARLAEEGNRVLEGMRTRKEAQLENQKRILADMQGNADYHQKALERDFKIADQNIETRKKQLQYNQAEQIRRAQQAVENGAKIFEGLASLSSTALQKSQEAKRETEKIEFTAGIQQGIAQAGMFTSEQLSFLQKLNEQDNLSSLLENNALLAKEKGFDPNSIAKVINMSAKQRSGFLFGSLKQQTKIGYNSFYSTALNDPEKTITVNGRAIPYIQAIQEPSGLAAVQAEIAEQWIEVNNYPKNHEMLKGVYEEIAAVHNPSLTIAVNNQTKALNEDTKISWDNAAFGDWSRYGGEAFRIHLSLDSPAAAHKWFKDKATAMNPDGSFILDDEQWKSTDVYGYGAQKGKKGRYDLDFKSRALEIQNAREEKLRQWNTNQATTDRQNYRLESKDWHQEWLNNPTKETLAAASESFSDNMEGEPEWLKKAKASLDPANAPYNQQLILAAKDAAQRGILTQRLVTEVFSVDPAEGNKLQELLDKQNPLTKNKAYVDQRKNVGNITKKPSATVPFPQDSIESSRAGRILQREYDALVQDFAVKNGGNIDQAADLAAAEIQRRISADQANPQGRYYRVYDVLTGTYKFPALKDAKLTQTQAAKEQAQQFQFAMDNGRQQELINTKFGVLTQTELKKEVEKYNQPGYTPNLKLVLAAKGVDGGVMSVLNRQLTLAGEKPLEAPLSLQRVAAYSPSAQRLLQKHLNANVSTRVHGYEGSKMDIEWNSHLVPGQYRESIELHSKAFGVAPAIIAAQLEVESSWNPGSRSPAGAKGLAQFMPATAQQYGVNVNDANDSIRGMSQYMRDLMKQFGDPIVAAGAYNAGPGRMREHLETGAPLPAETVNHMRKVAKAYYKYSGDNRVLQRPEVIRQGMLLPAGAVIPFERDPLPSTGDHLDTRILVMSGPNKGQRIDPNTRPDLLARIYIGKTPKDAVPLTSFKQTSGYGERPEPTAGASTFHRGIDWAIRSGMKIFVKDGERYYRDKGTGVVPITDAAGNKFELELYHTE